MFCSAGTPAQRVWTSVWKTNHWDPQTTVVAVLNTSPKPILIPNGCSAQCQGTFISPWFKIKPDLHRMLRLWWTFPSHKTNADYIHDFCWLWTQTCFQPLLAKVQRVQSCTSLCLQVLTSYRAKQINYKNQCRCWELFCHRLEIKTVLKQFII